MTSVPGNDILPVLLTCLFPETVLIDVQAQAQVSSHPFSSYLSPGGEVCESRQGGLRRGSGTRIASLSIRCTCMPHHSSLKTMRLPATMATPGTVQCTSLEVKMLYVPSFVRATVHRPRHPHYSDFLIYHFPAYSCQYFYSLVLLVFLPFGIVLCTLPHSLTRQLSILMFDSCGGPAFVIHINFLCCDYFAPLITRTDSFGHKLSVFLCYCSGNENIRR